MLNNEKKRILVLLGQSAYNVLRQAAIEIAKGFRQCGYEVDILDLLLEGYIDPERINREYSFAFSCNALMFENEEIMMRIHIPYLGWIFDDPMYHYRRVVNSKRRNALLIFADQEWKEIAGRLNRKLYNRYFLPCGGFVQQQEEKKVIDILFPAVYSIEELSIENKVKDLSSIEQEIVKGAIQALCEDQMLSVYEAIEHVFQGWGIEIMDDIMRGLVRVVECIDSYYRHNLRRNILLAILNAGFHVHVVGGLHEELLPYKDQLSVYPPQEIDDLVRLIGKSKIVISPQLVARKGISERIPTALLGKAVCFSPVTEYLQNEYKGMIEPIYLNDLSQMVERIEWILKHFDEYTTDIVDRNYNWAIENDTWECRGKEIIELYNDLV